MCIFIQYLAFSRTNLLTRCHSASSCFLLFLYFIKVVLEIFSELDETKAEGPIFLDTSTESKAETEEGTEVATPCHGAGPPLAAPPHGVGPSGAHRHCPFANILPRRKNPKSISLHPRKVLQLRRHRRQVLGDRNLCSGTLPGRGIAPGAISIDSTAISIAVADSHDEERVVLPRG